MKHIKTYKLFEKTNNEIFWYIEGDFNQVLKVLEKYASEHPEYEEDMIEVLKYFNMSDEKNIIGLYFYLYFIGGKADHSFYKIENEKQKKDADNYYHDSEYGGIMKIKNDKIYIDTMMIDAEKYNL